MNHFDYETHRDTERTNNVIEAIKAELPKAFIGVASPLGGWLIGRQQELELGFRLASMAAGILVAVLSSVSIFLTIRRKLKQQEIDDELDN